MTAAGSTPGDVDVAASLLASLRTAGDIGVSVGELAAACGVAPEAVWAAIDALRSEGFVLENNPVRGVRLVSTPAALLPSDLLSRCRSCRVVGREIRVLSETTSTNDRVVEWADSAREGLVVFAETQTRGRGRHGRRWESPRGQGLWFSVLLRPGGAADDVSRWTVAAAVAIRRAIVSETGVAVRIKWPNDLHVGGRKLGGVLTEARLAGGRIRFVVIGVGLNVNIAETAWPPELLGRATSLRVEAGGWVDRVAVAAAVLRELDAAHDRVRSGDFGELAAEWTKHCDTLGRWVTVVDGGRRVAGWAESIDAQGALGVRNEHGRLERVTGGEVLT